MKPATSLSRLLEKHGQGGNCGYPGKLFYHNSFLIADPKEAWVLETAGPHWAAERVRDVRTISNRITIGGRWDLASADLVSHAVKRRWCRGRDDFDFGRCYSDFLFTRFSDARRRQCRTGEFLEARKGRLTVADLMSALRDHGPAAGPDWTPARGFKGADVCDHAGFGPIRRSQSTGSLVSHLAPGLQTHFLTGTSAPCTSIFKPVWLGAELPESGPAPTGTYDEASALLAARSAPPGHVEKLRGRPAALRRGARHPGKALRGRSPDQGREAGSRAGGLLRPMFRRGRRGRDGVVPEAGRSGPFRSSAVSLQIGLESLRTGHEKEPAQPEAARRP